MKQLKNVTFDLSLARGLDYYTGMIFEIVLHGSEVGSISGGGRYDELIGMFAKEKIPSVGGSLGIERIFSILETKAKNVRKNKTEVFIGTIGNDPSLLIKKLSLASTFWENGIATEYLYATVAKPR